MGGRMIVSLTCLIHTLTPPAFGINNDNKMSKFMKAGHDKLDKWDRLHVMYGGFCFCTFIITNNKTRNEFQLQHTCNC